MHDTDPWLPGDPANLLVADPARREPVSLESDGNRLAAHLYRPSQAASGEVTPGIVMTGPVSSVKEQTLPHYRRTGRLPKRPATRPLLRSPRGSEERLADGVRDVASRRT